MNGSWVFWFSGVSFGTSLTYLIYRLIDEATMKTQATKGTRNEVLLHISRQRAMGERLIGDYDRPRRWELIVTLAVVMLLFAGTLGGWW